MDHSSFYESLAIPESHPIQAGTLLLNSVTPVDDSREEEEGGEGITAQDEAHKGQSQSLGSPAWRIYAPGALLDSSGEAALRGSSASATPTRKGRGTATRGHKRKRSSVSSSVEESSTARPKSAAPVVPVPSLAELDHVVTNIFLRLEYALVNPSSSDYGDAHSGTHGALFRVYVVSLDAPGLNSKIVARKLKIRSTHNKLVAQKALHKVFHHLRYDYDEWQSGQLNTDAPMLLHRNPTPPSLLEVYNSLDDPSIGRLSGVSPEAQEMLLDILKEDAPEGMYSRLYEFQKQCLWKLASRELAPQRQIDLSYRPLQALTGAGGIARTYFLDSGHFVWETAPYYLEPRSAIVSEGMGTGKTCICLALILVTRHRLVNVELEDSTIGTVSSVRTGRQESFPWLEDAGAPPANPYQDDVAPGERAARPFPSLQDLTLDLLYCSKHYKQLSIDPSTHTPSSADLPYIWEEPPSKGRDGTRSVGSTKRKVYLSAATIVIVPDILVAQWLAEIDKHVKEDALEYIKLEKGDVVPNEAELCKLDLVLISEAKIRSEEGRFWSATAPPCQCPYRKNTRTIDCRCKKIVDKGSSPLVGVYWKRLIVDEGHKVAGHGELVRLCMRLRTESRYVVSGTPSKNLVGIHDVENASSANVTDPSAGSGDSEKQDFERLANISTFMGLRPFSEEHNSQLFMRVFYEPFKSRGDISGIQSFLSRTMVRHQVPEVALPPLTREKVMLDFNPLERLTYNTLLALFASNSVLTERTDEDYFFHAKQKGALNSLVSNLGAAHLLFSSDGLQSAIAHAIEANRKGFEADDKKPSHLRWQEADRQLLTSAQEHLLRASGSELWAYAQTGSMVYQVRGIGQQLVDAWAGHTPASANPGLDGLPDLPDAIAYMTGEKIAGLRQSIGKQASEGDWLVASGEDFEEELITSALKELKRLSDERAERERPRAKGEKPAKRRTREASEAPSARKAAVGAYKRGTGNEKAPQDYHRMPMSCTLHFSTLPSIASTKVAYVIRAIQEAPEEKFLVFAGGSSSSANVTTNNLYYLAEALDLANIPHLIFVRTLTQEKLAAYAKAFSESSVFRVLLLDLRFAARGLTLSKATRIIFTEPVWHKDEEAQAVKRAHRLGQDRPVHVETLVMRDSFEERVVRRGDQLSRRETAEAKNPYEDIQLYRDLQSMQFLPDIDVASRPSGMFTPFTRALTLLPAAFDEDTEMVLHSFQRDTQEQLREIASSAARAASASRSGSAQPASRATTPALSQSASSEDLPEAPTPAHKTMPLKKRVVLMSMRSRLRQAQFNHDAADDEDDDDDTVVVAASSSKMRRVAFADDDEEDD